MSMEVMAVKFPDIYNEFLAPKTVTCDEAEINSSNYSHILGTGSRTKDVVHDSNRNMTMMNKHNMGQHPDQDQHYKTILAKIQAGVGGPVSAHSEYVPALGFQNSEQVVNHARDVNTFEGADRNSFQDFADLDDILSALEKMDGDTNENTSTKLGVTKNAYGCTWSDSTLCSHGDACPFINHFLGLGELNTPLLDHVPMVHNVVVLSQTPTGMVKLQESLVPIGQEEKEVLQAMTPEAQVRHLGLNTSQLRHRQQDVQNQVMSSVPSKTTLQLRDFGEQEQPAQYSYPSITSTQYSTSQYSHPFKHGQEQGVALDQDGQYSNNSYQFRTPSSGIIKFRSTDPVPYNPPPNAVIVKIPSPAVQSPYYPVPTPTPTTYSTASSPPGSKTLLLCTECDTQFHDSKTLGKHTRNQHNVYKCDKCGEETVGYYRMASHNKKNHSKEPIFFCMCGRTFAEKRGLTKHQNTCTFYKN